MVGLDTALRLVGGLALLLSNGFFVTTEFALTRVRQFPEAEFRGNGRGLDRAWEMTERLEIYLSGCQLGITVSSVGLGVVAEPAVAAVLDPAVRAVGLGGGAGGAGHTALAVVGALALINLLHVIVGEQAPTYLGIERTKTGARYGAPLLYWWTKVTWPVIAVADRVAKGLLRAFGVDITRSWAEEEVEGDGDGGPPTSRADLHRRMGETLRAAGLDDERREEVLNALAIGSRPVEAIMVPREEAVALSTTEDFETNLERIREAPHTRFPLVEENLDAFRGIVYAPALLARLDGLGDGLDLREVAAPPLTVDGGTTVSDLIDRFQAESQELALVTDGGADDGDECRDDDDGDGRGDGDGQGNEVVGLVTATDAFEAIAGELEDPLDGRTGQ